jgi:hypothetical protein
MNTIYKNNLYLICLSFLVIISNSSCVDSDIGLQPKNKDMQTIPATEEEKKKMCEEMAKEVAEKLEKAGISAEEYYRYSGGEARGSGMLPCTTCPDTMARLLWMDAAESQKEKARQKAVKGFETLTPEAQEKLYKEIENVVKQSVEKNAKKGKSNNELDVSLIEAIFRDKDAALRGALKADPYFFNLDRDCFVPDETTGVIDFKIDIAYHNIVEKHMGYDPFEIIDF